MELNVDTVAAMIATNHANPLEYVTRKLEEALQATDPTAVCWRMLVEHFEERSKIMTDLTGDRKAIVRSMLWLLSVSSVLLIYGVDVAARKLNRMRGRPERPSPQAEQLFPMIEPIFRECAEQTKWMKLSRTMGFNILLWHNGGTLSHKKSH